MSNSIVEGLSLKARPISVCTAPFEDTCWSADERKRNNLFYLKAKNQTLVLTVLYVPIRTAAVVEGLSSHEWTLFRTRIVFRSEGYGVKPRAVPLGTVLDFRTTTSLC